MKLALHSFAALTAGAMILALAPVSHAQTAAHGIQPVIDGTSPLGPIHGQGLGTWVAPGLEEGHLSAKLYDSQGVQRFTLNASLSEYLFIVAAPAQGEIHGSLLVPHTMPGRGVTFALTEIYGTVEGMWIVTGNGRGAFTASILRLSDDPDAPPVQLGLIEGTFQLNGAVQAGRVQASQVSLVNAPASSNGSSATNAMGLVQLVPPAEILPGYVLPPAHGIQLVNDDIQRRPMNNHGGLGQVGQGGSGTGSAQSITVNALRGRATLRWQLFE